VNLRQVNVLTVHVSWRRLSRRLRCRLAIGVAGAKRTRRGLVRRVGCEVDGCLRGLRHVHWASRLGLHVLGNCMRCVVDSVVR
jgi:hypothetical protein